MARRFDGVDDERDEPRQSAGGDSGGATAVKILAIVGAVLLVVVLVCGGLGAFAIYMMVNAADRALQDMQRLMEEEMKKQREIQEQQRKLFEKR